MKVLAIISILCAGACAFRGALAAGRREKFDTVAAAAVVLLCCVTAVKLWQGVWGW